MQDKNLSEVIWMKHSYNNQDGNNCLNEIKYKDKNSSILKWDLILLLYAIPQYTMHIETKKVVKDIGQNGVVTFF